MTSEKVIVLGFHKTGTSSIDKVLKDYNFNVHGVDKKILKLKKRKDIYHRIKQILNKYDAVQDMPWPLFYKELYELYPNAKFILTYRQPDFWIRSVIKYFASIRIPLHQKIYGVPCAEGYKDTYLAVYNKLNDEIINFFEHKKNFLLMDMNKNFNYETIDEFLELKQVKRGQLFNLNKNKQNLSEFKLYRQLRSFFLNTKKGY